MERLDDYLHSKGIETHRGPGSELIVHCWFCPDGDPKEHGRLYLNQETWLWDCKRCGQRGNRRLLMRHFGDQDDLELLPAEDPALRRRIMDETAILAHEMLLANDDALEYLIGRGLNAETIAEHRLGYVPKGFSLARSLPGVQRDQIPMSALRAAGVVLPGGQDFFSRSIVIPYVSHGQVVTLRQRLWDGGYRTLPGDHDAKLWNADALHDTDEVIITEGEFDCMILRQKLAASSDPALRAIGVLALPGVQTTPENFLDQLRTCRRVFIGFDTDAPGRSATQKYLRLIGRKARDIQLPGPAKPKVDWTSWFAEGHDWRDAANLIGDAEMRGKRVMSISDVRLTWSRWRTEKPGLKTGLKLLDLQLTPGLKPGQIVIPVGYTGSGKTAFLANLVHNMRSQTQLVLSLELTGAEFFERLRRIHAFWNPQAEPEQLTADYRKLGINDENKVPDIASILEEFKGEHGTYPRVLYVDYLGYYARGFGSEAYLRTSDAVMELKALAKEFSMTVIAPSQVSKMADDGKPLDLGVIRDSGVVGETGDFVFGLFRPDMVQLPDGTRNEGATGNFQVQLLKSRSGGAGKVFHHVMSSMSLAIVDRTDARNVGRVQQENLAARRGETYEDFMAQHHPAQRSLDLPGRREGSLA